MKILYKILFFLIFLCQTSFGQREYFLTTDLSAQLGSNTETSFWLRANQFGAAPKLAQTGVFQMGSSSNYLVQSKNKINWGYGFNLIGFGGAENKLFIQEAYFKAKWKALEIYGGRRKEIQGLVDTTLSSGSYIWSGNALPMPKVEISIPNFTPLRTNGLLSLKGNFAHGWFENTRSDAKNMYLHQKSLYFRIGKENQKMKLYGGFNHQAQWGGIAQFTDSTEKVYIGSSLGSFKDIGNIVLGKSQAENTATTANDSLNRIGNHLGTVDIGFELNFSKLTMLLYRQSIFEDGSLFYLNNITDGLNGIGLKFKNNNTKAIKLLAINFEFLNTLNQGGSHFDDVNFPNIRGNDNYFNNGIAREGWSYNKDKIGTPFITMKNEIIESNGGRYFDNNRVQAYYFSFISSIKDKTKIIGSVSFSKNYGTYIMIKKDNQISYFIGIEKRFETKVGIFEGYFRMANDIGTLLENNVGIQLGIKRSFGLGEIKNLFNNNGNPTHKHYF